MADSLIAMPTSSSFRQLMGCFATGITVITAKNNDDRPVGITINSLTSVSLKPPLVLFCLDRAAHVYPVFKNADVFAVNILSSTQERLARHFADFRRYPSADTIWDKPQKHCPILKHTLAWMLCRKVKTHEGGDHDILLGEVLSLHKRTSPQDPLLYFHGRYQRLKA
jgi:flavin reductase (DIM6/NTAB) family NADH-FMN oxidoreductase RutF